MTTLRLSCPHCGKALDVKVVRTPVVDAGETMSPLDIAYHLAEALGYSFEVIKGKARQRHIVDARAIVARALRDELGLKLIEIGEILDRDHSTVINLLKRGPLIDSTVNVKRLVHNLQHLSGTGSPGTLDILDGGQVQSGDSFGG